MKKAFFILSAITLVSCQQQSGDPPAEEKPVPAEESSTAGDPADPKSYIGMTLESAGSRAEKAEIPWRIIEADGKPRAVTMDHRPNRLNFAVAEGKIIRVTNG